jgi:hypothetical protein
MSILEYSLIPCQGENLFLAIGPSDRLAEGESSSGCNINAPLYSGPEWGREPQFHPTVTVNCGEAVLGAITLGF